ncbi:DUF2577 domain-containing protein [Paenibacillus ehimensis]|uniref:DUF2577 domain-containing protein n=1 Tax=Paenibacillus ehimensis TaxID=79264 RepID=UPI002DB63474|nr:DUF2577 domain-containing protein [Paenibacillus ehimensis]MEC0212626.1 DUF2577 domain-containing protein [Paenibacillus ehimensis]
MGLLNLIKQAGLDAVEAGNPVSVIFGTVASESPLSVTIDQRFTLTEDFLIVPEQLTDYRVTVEGQEIVIREGLKTGNRVILLRMQGGEQYVIVDRVVTA